ncbi:hypothetical protein [Sphingomonas oryzagri]|uniref:Uncharacterized protein n=1 Tax=Sphingomonas oryzagri TaxID=3042314 RepID=A0ABT6N6Q9_9SPHN|nr:hypothetical protein [Sphingomonas oryzagri]MDH7640781.1 hypothetical protein [Sphingomonas oryzagri]
MARFILAALAGATLVASPVLASQPVRPSGAALKLQPVGLQSNARVGAKLNKKGSDLTTAATGGLLAALVGVGIGVGIATSGSNSTSP